MSIVEKDVTLRQQDNAGEYDKLYVATTATQTKLTASTAALFDGDVKNADDAMVAIAEAINNIGYVKLKILDPNGNPIQGAIIEGMTGTPVTLADGTAHGIVESNPITVVSPYIDLANKTVDITGIGPVVAYAITLPVVADKTITFSASKAIKFSTATSTVDVCLVGGGGGGSDYTSAQVFAGGGGGGGETKNVYNVPITANQAYQVVVGSGGAVAAAGGYSEFENYRATGGLGASGSKGGQGAGGNGGNSNQAGSDNTTVSMFDDGKTFYGGGGGGGARDSNPVPKGGSPNGASGASAHLNINAGTAGIGGGGGGGSYYYITTQGGYVDKPASEGGNGLVVVRLK